MTHSMTNIAILAHIDAGKTTLSERLLFLSNKISAMGLVEDGLATMDYLLEEKRRGITIEAGYSSFQWKNRTINFVDTPGHVDFGVEVDCTLDSIEAGVVVVSGIRKVQTQTYSAWHKLEDRKVPTLIFINKLDSPQAEVDETLLDVEMAFECHPLVMSYPYYEEEELIGVVDVISQKLVVSTPESRQVEILDIPENIAPQIQRFYSEVCEFVAENSEEALDAHLAGELKPEMIYQVLSEEFAKKTFAPVYCGSAKMMVGVRLLANGLKFLVPVYQGHSNPQSDALILKVRNSPQFGRFYLVKAFKSLISRDGMQLYGVDAETLEKQESVAPGELSALVSTSNFRIGDEIRWEGDVVLHGATPTYNPLIEVQMEPMEAEQQSNLKQALEFFLESDPSLKVKYNEHLGNWKVSTIGEVHLQVLIARLRDEFQVPVQCGDPEIKRLEKWQEPQLEFEHSTAWAENSLKIKFSIEPYSRQEFEWNYYGKLSNEELIKSVIQSALNDFTQQGITGAGQLINLRFNLSQLEVEGQLLPGMLKKLILDGLKENIKQEHIAILEPHMDMELITPEEFSGKITADLKSRQGKIQNIDSDGKHNWIRCEIPLIKTFGYATWLRDISKGRASYGLQYHDHK